MSNNIVPMRPRDQVQRRIQSGATTPAGERLPVYISSELGICRLLRGLATVGITLRLDHITNSVVIEEVQHER